MTGKNNEDRYAVSAYQLGPDNATPSLFAVLCDGIGGHRAGEVAAEIAVNTISQVVAESDASQPIQILQNAVQAASQRIYGESQSNGERRGMGSTCACVWVIGSRLYIVSVGDSRIYLQRGDAIYQLTTDHTWVQELLEIGQITPEQVHGHPNAHVIRRYLGSAVPPAGDFRLRMGPGESDELAIANQGLALRSGDRVLLCSDGLTDLVAEGEIRSTLGRRLPFNPDRAHQPTLADGQELESSVRDLIDLANQRGGHDNITIVVLQMGPEPAVEPQRSWFAKRWRLAVVGCLGLAVVGLFAGMVAVGLPWLEGRLHATPNVQTSPMAGTTTALAPGGLFATGTPFPPAPTIAGGPTIANLTFTPSEQATMGPSLTPWPTNTLPVGISDSPSLAKQ
jgi:protein phosphatase